MGEKSTLVDFFSIECRKRCSDRSRSPFSTLFVKMDLLVNNTNDSFPMSSIEFIHKPRGREGEFSQMTKIPKFCTTWFLDGTIQEIEMKNFFIECRLLNTKFREHINFYTLILIHKYVRICGKERIFRSRYIFTFYVT